MQKVFIAGSTGYLGRYLCAEYRRRGWHVTALVRSRARAGDLAADTLVEAEATRPDEIAGVMESVELTVSALGITRPADGLGYREVDYGANLILLREAERAGVQRFAYVHVPNAKAMRHVPPVAAKADFVDALLASSMPSTVIAPSGYFSDMEEFPAMARSGRVWLFGSGAPRINPIHGADLAAAIAEATEARRAWVDIGGPGVLTQTEIARLAFAALGREPHITCLPDMLQKAALTVLPWVTPRRVSGPAQFFLTAMAIDMVGARHGDRSLAEHFRRLAAADQFRTEQGSPK